MARYAAVEAGRKNDDMFYRFCDGMNDGEFRDFMEMCLTRLQNDLGEGYCRMGEVLEMSERDLKYAEFDQVQEMFEWAARSEDRYLVFFFFLGLLLYYPEVSQEVRAKSWSTEMFDYFIDRELSTSFEEKCRGTAGFSPNESFVEHVENVSAFVNRMKFRYVGGCLGATFALPTKAIDGGGGHHNLIKE